MIADWTVEVGHGCPVIELPWNSLQSGWIDLRPWAHSAVPGAQAIPELQAYPELAPLLKTANRGCFATAKLDVFCVDRSEADPEIMEEPLEQTMCGLGSYLDVLRLCDSQLGDSQLAPFAFFERVARVAAEALARTPQPLCTAEIVVRRARLYDQDTFGWTLYAVGFGPNQAHARQSWSAAAGAVVNTLLQANAMGE